MRPIKKLRLFAKRMGLLCYLCFGLTPLTSAELLSIFLSIVAVYSMVVCPSFSWLVSMLINGKDWFDEG